jgi:hypothetical protein
MKQIFETLKINEEGSSGGLLGSAIVFVGFSLMCIIIGKVMDAFVKVNNGYIGSLPISQDAINTMGTLSLIFQAIPFLFLLFLVINHLVLSNRDSGGDV